MAASYQSNSFKSAEETSDEEVKKVKPVEGKVIVRKKGVFKKFFETIFSDDPDSVKTYVVQEVLVPALKKSISDVVSNGTDILLYGESRRPKQQNSSGGSRISYSSYSGYYSQPNRNEPSKRESNAFDQDVILETRGQAESVLIQLEEAISKYKMVSVADLNDILGVTGSYTDNKYGWYDLSSAQITRDKSGYALKLPRVRPLS